MTAAPAARAALALARRHWALLVLLAAGAALRVLLVAAYVPAFQFPDTLDYLRAAQEREPMVHRPFGYSAFLALLDGLVPFRAVALVQHLLGLGAAVLVYAVLVRRGVRPGWAALAAAPLVLDGYLLAVEHYLLAESLFVALLALAVALLLWRERPGWALAGAAGLVLAAAALTRNVGTFVVAVVGLYLLVRLVTRSVRWTAVVSFGLAAAVTLLGYFAWFDSHHGRFSSTAYTGHFLYGRVSQFVECDRVDVPERLAGLCPSPDLADRRDADYYVWNVESPANSGRWTDDDLAAYARAAIAAQPEDYLRTTLRAIVMYADPTRAVGPRDPCPQFWELPRVEHRTFGCWAQLAGTGFDLEPVPSRVDEDLADVLRDYQRTVYTWGPLLGLLAVGATGAALLRRGLRLQDRLDPLVLVAVGLVLVGVPSATAVFDYRYGLPTLVVLPAAAALAARRLPARGPAEERDDRSPDQEPASRVLSGVREGEPGDRRGTG